MVDSEKVVDLQSQVNALKNETLKLKEHLSKARQATNQVRNIWFFLLLFPQNESKIHTSVLLSLYIF